MDATWCVSDRMCWLWCRCCSCGKRRPASCSPISRHIPAGCCSGCHSCGCHPSPSGAPLTLLTRRKELDWRSLLQWSASCEEGLQGTLAGGPLCRSARQSTCHGPCLRGGGGGGEGAVCDVQLRVFKGLGTTRTTRNPAQQNIQARPVIRG